MTILEKIAKHHKTWVRQVISFGCKPSDAEDVVQNMYLKVNTLINSGLDITFDDDINAIALHKSGIVAAFRNVPVQAPSSLIDLQRVDLPNGIPVQLRTFSDVKSGKLVQVAETMAGFEVANGDAIETASAT